MSSVEECAPECAGEGLRERKKRATRDALHRAALELVQESGFAAVTTEQIAARADVSPRTFFNYFATKQDAVLGFRDEDVQAVAAWLEHRPADEPLLDGVRAAVVRILAPADADPQLRRLRREILFAEPAVATAIVANNIAVEQALVSALERRRGVEPDSDLRLRVTVAAGLAVMRSCMGLFKGQYHQPQFEATLDEGFAQLARGLA